MEFGTPFQIQHFPGKRSEGKISNKIYGDFGVLHL